MTGEKWHNIGEKTAARCIATLGVTPNGQVFGIRCKKWSCDVCAPINALYKAIETANGVHALFTAGLLPYFVTLTQPATVKTAEHAYSILASQWDGFRNRWQYWARKNKFPNYYAAFVEGQGHREGMPHFHIIGTAFPRLYRVKEWAQASGLGVVADRSHVAPNSGAAWYVSKYSTKGSDAASMPRNFRRVRFSQDWPRMLFRHDIREGEACVKRANESVTAWAYRASLQWWLNPDLIAQDALRVLDSAKGQEAANYAEALSEFLLA